MPRAALLVLALCFSILVYSQTLNAQVQVVYLLGGTTLTTYNVDPQTLNASEVATLSVTQYPSPGLTTSPDGHFVYYSDFGFTPDKGNRLWVYATDSTGSPQNPAVQELNGTYLWGLPQFDPKANFAYLFSAVTNKSDYTEYTVWRFAYDPKSGKLSQKQSVASYYLFSNPSGNDCSPTILGFSADGTRLYDEVACYGPYNSSSATYNERSVDLQTGMLGPDQQLFNWTNGDAGGYESVQFVNNLIFNFVTPNDFQQGIESVNIYPLQPGTGTPFVQCNAAMLEACGYSTGVAHPSADYVFMQISSDDVQIDRVELTQNKIVDTGNYIPSQFGKFSPDGTIVYGYSFSDTSADLSIYGFDVSTSTVTPGGTIYIPSNVDSYFVAERY